MSHWTDLLTASELAAHHALTAALDPAFAAAQRRFYETRTRGELRALQHQSWLCNDSGAYQLARSYAALAETPETR